MSTVIIVAIVVGFVYTLLMTKPYTPLTEYQLCRISPNMRVRCDVCFVWACVDDIVWRRPDGSHAVCDECQEDEHR